MFDFLFRKNNIANIDDLLGFDIFLFNESFSKISEKISIREIINDNGEQYALSTKKENLFFFNLKVTSIFLDYNIDKLRSFTLIISNADLKSLQSIIYHYRKLYGKIKQGEIGYYGKTKSIEIMYVDESMNIKFYCNS